MRGTIGAAGNLLQRLAQQLRITLFKGQLGLHLEAGQRGAHLMGGVGNEALLRLQVFLQPRHHVVERHDQGTDLFGHTGRLDRRQVIGTAPADAALQAIERRDAARQPHPHQNHRQRDDCKLRQQHTGHHPGGKVATFVAGFSHLHQHHRMGFGFRLEKLVCDPYLFALDEVVPVEHLLRIQRVGRVDPAHFGIAGDQRAVRPRDLVIHHIILIGAEQRTWRRRKINPHLAGLGGDQPRERAHIVSQRQVIGLVGDIVRDRVGDDDGDWPQKQQRRKHPVQDLAKQGIGLGRCALGGRTPLRLSPPAPHQGAPGSIPGPARSRSVRRCPRASCAGGARRLRSHCSRLRRPNRTDDPRADPC